MAKTKISEFSTTAGNNTDINSINIAEGCAPSGINDAIRELMRQLKEFQTGGAGDSVNSGGDFSVATNKFTVAAASGNTAVAGTLAVTGVATLTAQPILSSLTASKAVFTDASKGLVSNDVTGTGNVVMSNSPTLVTPALGTPSSGVVTNLTGTASININGTVGATTPSTGAFTTLSSTGNTTLGDASGDTITVNGTTTFVNANPTLSAGTANGVLYLDGSKVATAGSALTFDGTNLGIGTSSPDSKLTVATTSGSTYVNVKRASQSTGEVGISLSGGTSGVNWIIYQPTSSNNLQFYRGSDLMTLDSSGNLGLGVTPSGWTSIKALQVVNASFGGLGGGNYSAANAYYDGTNWKYITSNYATLYQQSGNAGDGVHKWNIAASGTAGNAITFTQAMTLDASGNLGVGITTTQGKVSIQQSLSGTYGSAGIWLTDNATTSMLLNNTSSGVSSIWASGALTFGAGGNNNTERARIDSSGNLLVGTTSSLSGSSHSFKAIGTTAANYAGVFRQDATGSNGRVFAWQLPNTSDSASYFVYAENSGGNCLNIFGNGNITNSNNSYGAISDAKLKENVTDATPKLEKLNQVRVVNYNLIGGEQKQIGVIAQELEQIFPSMVEETADKDVDGNDLGTTTKSVKYSVFVPMLIKAMQEQQAIIQQLTARVAQLESN